MVKSAPTLITLNGEIIELSDKNNELAKVIASFELPVRYAIVINQQIIPKSFYNSTKIVAGDKIEIIAAVGGG